MSYKVKKIIITFVSIELILTIAFFISQNILLRNTISAIKEGNSSEVLSAMENLYNIDAEGPDHETVLSAACEKGDKQAIAKAISLGANPNKKYGYLLTPLELFCSYGYDGGPDALKELLSAGVDLKTYTNKPAIMILAEKTYDMNEEQKSKAVSEINLLVRSGAKLSYEKETVLHYAARSNLSNLVYTLIRTPEGISLINSVDADGNTPYQVSVKYGAVAVQRVIREFEKEAKKELGKRGALTEDQNTPSDDGSQIDDYQESQDPTELLPSL